MKKTKIDKEYFESYAGRGLPYSKTYKEHSGIVECIELFEREDAPRLQRICVLGTATGETLKDFYKTFGLKPYGCEINEWAYQQIDKSLRKRVHLQDIRHYVDSLIEWNVNFDLVFTNALVYISRRELPGLLKKIARVTRFIHFDSSFVGTACPDPYRKTLATYDWWNQRMKRAGFEELTTVFGEKTYLWKSRVFSK